MYRDPELQRIIKKRKERFFPTSNAMDRKDTKTLFFGSHRASITVEAAMVLPLFLFCMIAALQYCRAMETAVRFSAALSETGKSLAVDAYATTFARDAPDAAAAVARVASTVYAQEEVMKRAGDTSAVKNANMILSSIMKEGENIDLVMTYQIASPFQILPLPSRPFLQRASVRAWVGRKEGGSGDEKEEAKEEEIVYVTVTGQVYHRDLNCSYLNLSISSISADEIEGARNLSGAKYYSCELCGADCGSTVYITSEGNRYHSSLSCSGLKRTVQEMPLSETNLRPCSRCG